MVALRNIGGLFISIMNASYQRGELQQPPLRSHIDLFNGSIIIKIQIIPNWVLTVIAIFNYFNDFFNSIHTGA